MFVVELVMQGVRGIRELARLRFQSGFNFVAAGNEAGKTTAVDSLQRLLFPVNAAEAIAPLVSRSVPDASRGAVVVGADDGTYYRVIQDFSKQAVNLSQYHASTKEFKLMHKDWDNAARHMSGLAAGVSEDDFSRVFLFRREQYGDWPHAVTAAAAAPQPAGGRSAAPVPGAAGSTAAQARLAELRESLKKAEEAADADYRWQSAKLALEELKKKIAAHEESDSKRQELEANLAGLAGCETLPSDVAQLLEEHELRESKQSVDADELIKERDGLQMQLDGIPAVNMFTDKWFIAGSVLFVISILAGMFFLTEQYSQFFPVAVLVAVILMAVSWYNSSRRGAQRKAVVRDIEIVNGDLEELTRKFNQESAKIAGYMKAVNAATAAELKEKTENYRYYLSLLKDYDETRARSGEAGSRDVLQQQLEQQQDEARTLEKEAQALASQAIDTYALRQEIERLELEAAPSGPSWNTAARETDLPTDFTQPPVPAGGRFSAELGAACRIGSIEQETLVPAVEAAAQRNLAAISGGRYVRIEVGHDGDPVVHAKDDTHLGYRDLSHGTRELVYFCLRTGLIEALAGKRRLPFILDDALAGFDPVRQQAACQVLRTLGAKTQVILFCANPALKAPNDSGSELK